MEATFNEGDWALLGDKPVQIKTKKDNGSYSVSTGTIETSGRLGDRLYPMTLQNKSVADSAAYTKSEMHNLCRSINWPDLASWFEQGLADAADDKDKQKEFLDKLREVYREMQDIQDMWFKALPDIAVFRRVSR